MTKLITNAFVQDVTTKDMTEREAVEQGSSGRHVNMYRTASNDIALDIALSGNATTLVPSLRDPGSPPPKIKLRRYIARRNQSDVQPVVAATSAGVDIELPAFRALVEKTEVTTGVKDHDAIMATMTQLLDRAAERKRTLDPNAKVTLSESVGSEMVRGVSRGNGKVRVDDYDKVLFNDARERQERSLSDRQPKRNEDPDPDRAERVREAARRKLAAKQQSIQPPKPVILPGNNDGTER